MSQIAAATSEPPDRNVVLLVLVLRLLSRLHAPFVTTATMRVRTLEIRWHDSKPISTCDFQPLPFKKARPAHDKQYPAQTYRLATGGEDNHVRVSTLRSLLRMQRSR